MPACPPSEVSVPVLCPDVLPNVLPVVQPTVVLPVTSDQPAKVVAITSRQSTIDALSSFNQSPPHVISYQSLTTSTGDSQLTYLHVKEGSRFNMLWVDLPALCTPSGNRQDRRLQDRIATWITHAFRAGCAVVVRGLKGPQWALAPMAGIAALPQFKMSRHSWCRYGHAYRACTFI